MSVRQGKQRQRNHLPPPIQASDYESDAQHYDNRHIPPATRTNTELNLSVLRRYNPSIRTILSIAANAVVYLFTPRTQTWEKSGVEGTLFVCDQEPTRISGDDSFCIVVLNRRGLDNIILDLGNTQDVEITNELLIMRFQDRASGNEQKVIGLWIHNDKNDTREVNQALIKECWERARESRILDAERAAFQGHFDEENGDIEHIEPVGVGKRISLTDLFQRAS
jgi:hypothetical protein